MIKLSYTVEQPEYLEAQRLYLKHRAKPERTWSVILLAVLFVGLFLFTWGTVSLIWAAVSLAITIPLSLGIGLLMKIVLRKVILRNRYKLDRRLMTNLDLILSDDGVVSSSAGIGHWSTEWTVFTGWAEEKNVFALFVGSMIRAIPKRVLTESDSQQLRDLLQTKIGPAGPPLIAQR